MKKALILFFIILCICVGIFFGIRSSSPIHNHSIAAVSVATPQVARPGIPTKILIPKINVETAIESVGQDAQGRMDVPKDPQNTGWYDLGFRPGEKGSAVIDGHLDTVTGAPAAFWFLSKLQHGDEIVVTDDHNLKHAFIVSDSAVYEYNKVPLQQIFATTDKPRLNLITCRGVFDKQTKNYSKRIVVYAVEK